MQRSAKVGPQMAVLGLVVQEPGTVADIARRMADQFPSAGFPRNSAHTNLPILAERGEIRVVVRGSRVLYVSTAEGVARMHEWIQRDALPAIPDVIQGKLEFAGLDDLRALVETLAEDERDSRRTTDLAHGALLSRKRHARGPADWRSEVDLLRLEDEALFWGGRAARLEKLIEGLARILDRVTTTGA
jgi:hypothetical protein